MKKLFLVLVFLLLAGPAPAIPPGGDSEGIPYSGATGAVDLGSQNLTTTGSVSGGNVVVGTTLRATGTGSPEGVVTANVGSEYRDTSTGAVYNKTSGAGNTGWVLSSFDSVTIAKDKVICTNSSTGVPEACSNLSDVAYLTVTSPTPIDGSAGANLTAAQMSDPRCSCTNQGQAASDIANTLPAAAANLSCLFNVGTAQSNKWGVRADTNDKIYLLAVDGTISAGSDNGYARMTAAQVGQSFACWSFTTGSGAYDWMCKAISIGTSTFAAN